ncbi:ulp1 protease family, C-terminal catalytic domain-containing protein [Tanacetum coccineum]|uniref:Ulp1 protease family, C-terminal catalytic domain-containing protein n=1 Tax=Tanacetum coccineum TaxID=301880 RepID=A0ABQ5F197_9ASTR
MDVNNQNKEHKKEKEPMKLEEQLTRMNNNDMRIDSCEEMENQAKEEIQKKKTAKRKSTKEMTPPSFSLGLSPDTNKTKDMFNWKMEDGKKYDEVKQYKAFSDTMKNEFKKDDEVKKLKDLEMKNMFFMHLKEVQHHRAKYVLNKKPTILRPKWGTEENNTDCGVFLMMHMENYNGENARNWNMEFPTKEEGNRYDIIKMRMRFAAKMLSYEINIHREEMSKQALEFADRNKEKKGREALIMGAIRVNKEKQESERV